MPNTKTLKRHAALVDRMAASLGVDLEENVLRARASMDELTDAVLRCTGCSNADHCEHVHLMADTGRTPSYCRNAEFLNALKA